MAVQAQLYPEGFCLPLLPQPLSVYGLQDWLLADNNNPGLEEVDHLWFTFQDPSPEQHHQLIPFLQQQQQINTSSLQSFGFDNWDRVASSFSSSSCSSSTSDSVNLMSMSLSRSLETQLDMQTQEFDHFLRLQNERLRCALQEQRKLQLSTLLKTMESKALCFVKQKEEELVQAIKKGVELEACLSKAQLERDSWETLAREKEAMVTVLSNALEQVKDGGLIPVPSSSTSGQEESCCSSSSYEERKKEKNQNDMMRMACKSCHCMGCCVLFLPCRHLCSCKSCEAFLASCPVCDTAKQASMEIFLV